MDDDAPTITSPFDLFRTNQKAEQDGVKVDYDDFWFYVGRTGGGNKRYTRIITERLRPHRRAIQTETIQEDLARKLAMETFAEGCVFGWGSKKHGEGVMVGKDGEGIAYSTAAVVEMFNALPELFQDLKSQADSFANYRDGTKDADAKN